VGWKRPGAAPERYPTDAESRCAWRRGQWGGGGGRGAGGRDLGIRHLRAAGASRGAISCMDKFRLAGSNLQGTVLGMEVCRQGCGQGGLTAAE
jgi:hypothetical protein